MSIDFDGIPGVYTYSQGKYGKTAKGIVAVGAQSDRNPYAQVKAGGSERLEGDHGGHLIAHSLGGKNEAINIDAQAANVNQIDQRHVERMITDLAENPNNTVYLEVSNYTQEGHERPDATMMTVAVQDNETGKVDIEYWSFANASHEEQESWNQIANDYDSFDPRQDIGMTEEQRSLANELTDSEEYTEEKFSSNSYTMYFDDEEYTETATNYDDVSETLESTSEYSGASEYSGSIDVQANESTGEESSVSME